MTFSGPKLLATPIDLCIVFQWKLNISCIMSCGNQLILTYISVDLLLLHYYLLELLLGGKNYNRCIILSYTWVLGVASKQLRLRHGRVGDSTIVVNSLSPQMSELVEDTIAS